ncbi:hypothetical protein BDY19DRAFT_901862 [Irpex rosettiformis]|uniref:Uncharacterized protein n=1 Tax=Irpex rosettiformis TaxID=378272 RepID=A0ACB8UJY2_9APHY|nr:hypothetical protein BDY19DRAFT_901862 [Irpex rosettiformis]
MSPTCTLPYEVLLELVNDTRHSITMQALHPEDEAHLGATILMHSAESISLVLTAGLPYRYGIRKHGKEAGLNVKIWHDTVCNLSTVFAASVPAMTPSDGTYSVADGIKVAFASFNLYVTHQWKSVQDTEV